MKIELQNRAKELSRAQRCAPFSAVLCETSIWRRHLRCAAGRSQCTEQTNIMDAKYVRVRVRVVCACVCVRVCVCVCVCVLPCEACETDVPLAA